MLLKAAEGFGRFTALESEQDSSPELLGLFNPVMGTTHTLRRVEVGALVAARDVTGTYPAGIAHVLDARPLVDPDEACFIRTARVRLKGAPASLTEEALRAVRLTLEVDGEIVMFLPVRRAFDGASFIRLVTIALFRAVEIGPDGEPKRENFKGYMLPTQSRIQAYLESNDPYPAITVEVTVPIARYRWKP